MRSPVDRSGRKRRNSNRCVCRAFLPDPGRCDVASHARVAVSNPTVAVSSYVRRIGCLSVDCRPTGLPRTRSDGSGGRRWCARRSDRSTGVLSPDAECPLCGPRRSADRDERCPGRQPNVRPVLEEPSAFAGQRDLHFGRPCAVERDAGDPHENWLSDRLPTRTGLAAWKAGALGNEVPTDHESPGARRSNEIVYPPVLKSAASLTGSPRIHSRSRRGCSRVLSAKSSALTVLRRVLARSLVLTTSSEENCAAGHGRGLLERTRTPSAAVLRSIRGHAAGFVGEFTG